MQGLRWSLGLVRTVAGRLVSKKSEGIEGKKGHIYVKEKNQKGWKKVGE
jgi:hypothetical protein